MSQFSESPFADRPPPKPGAAGEHVTSEILEPIVSPTLHPKPGMAYWESVNYVFRNPNWMSNVAWGILASLIPMAGTLIMMGYQFRVMDGLIRSQGETYPDFKWDDLEDYLMRGLWAIIVYMVFAAVVGPVVFGVFYCGLFGVFIVLASGGEQGPNPAATAAAIALGIFAFLVLFAVSFLLSLIIAPLMLRAGLGKDLGRAFNFPWVKDFAGKMWGEMLLAGLFALALVIPLWLVGALTCGIGLLPAAVIFQLAQSHLWSQWYLLFLQRGGEPIYLARQKQNVVTAQMYSSPPSDPPQRF